MSQTELDHILKGIAAAVGELTEPERGLIDVLRGLLAEPGSGAPDDGTATRRPPGSRAPWDAQVAYAYTSIGAWARHAEADLGTYVHGRYTRRTAGSDRNTRDALHNVLIHCEDGRVPEAEVRRIARALGTLVRAAQSCPGIDTAPAPAATLRQPCPYCGTGSLTAAMDGSTEIRCATDGCTDPVTGALAVWAKRDWPFLLSRLTQEAS